MSDTLLHLFLQSNLTCKEIDDVMKGRLTPDVIDSLWKVGGVKENSRYMFNLMSKILIVNDRTMIT